MPISIDSVIYVFGFSPFLVVCHATLKHTSFRGADSVKLPRSMKIPTKAAALSLPMISLCFLTKLALWSLFDNGFTYIQSLKQVLHHINLVFHKIYIPLMLKMSSVIHLLLSFILISHFRFVFPTICHNCRTWRLSCRVALLPCYPESAPRHINFTEIVKWSFLVSEFVSWRTRMQTLH